MYLNFLYHSAETFTEPQKEDALLVPQTQHQHNSNRITTLNPNYLKFVVNNETICSIPGNPNILLIYVSSNRKNFERRQLIRETWGSITRHETNDGKSTIWLIRTIFLVGLPLETETDEPFHDGHLAQESKDFRDIIMGNF